MQVCLCLEDYKIIDIFNTSYSNLISNILQMNTAILTGLIFIALGAFSSGSFAIPFGKIKGWKWESYWFIYCIGAYIIFPVLSCMIFSPGFMSVYKDVPSGTLALVFILGMIYGIGNLSFGLSLRYLGISLGYAFSLGLMLAIGTLIPPLIDGRLQVMMQTSGGNMLLAGVLVACLGIAFTGWAGYLKDKKLSEAKKQESIVEFSFLKGTMAAVLVGITGSAMSMGFEKALPINEVALKNGVDPLFASLPGMPILFLGTFVTTILYCLYLGIKNKSLKDYIQKKPEGGLIKNYSFALLAGFLWFVQLILFGMGKSKMGPFTFTSWGILMALTIVCATLWGVYRKEWKGAPVKVLVLMLVSLIIIIVSSFIISISGSL